MKPVIIIALFFIHFQSSFAQDSVWMAKTTGKLPFLEYGIGDDRLGGAKMTYLDSNIIVRIIDSFQTDYKIQLSRYHTAYISKESVVILKKEPNHRVVNNSNLSGSFKIYGDSAADYVVVNLPQALPYKSFQLLDPSRVIVDLYGVTSNTNWITQLRSVKEIKNTWYEQTEDDVMRVYIELKHVQHWGHTLYYDSTGKKLVIRIKRPPPVMDIRKLRIAIDPGHGGDNSGASGVNSKVLEKEYTLLIAKELNALLKKAGVKQVFMTRTRDTSLSMVDRVYLLRNFNPDILVSIHLNSADIDTVKGVSTYYRYIGYRSLSQALLTRMLELGLKEYGNVGNFNFALNGPTDYPNVLVETAFLSNPSDEKKILTVKFQKAVAQKIYLGIVDWLKQAK